ncbi:hypothetical protein DACRYDRAFT_21078 [Dacryopinax primogenitus]|uniref:Uncharacterized protein n=1 Tax=Dacryopinax primogenitus (strain DJM 731) TaxID=1858805 RepID=M5G498_DACPD|nr:uncharacterized protein DACRYDRAFT_21078 [Dacryopinax primogenitus]EJU03514.1 hypothetical protein DACRYDRAFT_21078 [Dacryopinax primogenitus]
MNPSAWSTFHQTVSIFGTQAASYHFLRDTASSWCAANSGKRGSDYRGQLHPYDRFSAVLVP